MYFAPALENVCIETESHATSPIPPTSSFPMPSSSSSSIAKTLVKPLVFTHATFPFWRFGGGVLGEDSFLSLERLCGGEFATPANQKSG